MTIAAVKTVRGLERGLALVGLLHRLRAATLHDLHVQSGLPKATLSRILVTLQRAGFAAQRIADDRWVPGLAIKGLNKRFAATDRLSQAAAPVLDALCARIIWPSDLSVRVGTHMELSETSRPHSSLMINRLRIGFPINMLMSAPGRAYLAFCPAEEREMVLKRMQTHDGPGHEWARNHAFVGRILDETRRLGYGARDPRWGGHIRKPKSKFDDGLNAIAVPIENRNGVLGCINIVWIRRLVSQNDIVRRHLGDLKEAAKRINLNYAHSAS